MHSQPLVTQHLRWDMRDQPSLALHLAPHGQTTPNMDSTKTEKPTIGATKQTPDSTETTPPPLTTPLLLPPGS